MNTRTSIESLAMDLKRMALCLHKNSPSTADVFEKEAWKRKNEVDMGAASTHLIRLLKCVEEVLKMPNSEERKAEDALMYSVLLQNYAQKSMWG